MHQAKDLLLSTALALCLAQAALAQETQATLARRFTESIHPILKANCFTCHGKEKQEAKLDLSGFATPADVARRHDTWLEVRERLSAGEMPPEKAPRYPTPAERKAVIDWINDFRSFEASKAAGDPGQVLPRRLSNAEYDYTIRDLTGVDIRPTREFPVDPANEAGFDNSGESLATSPALVKKYYAAARLVADHIALRPQGFVFAPHPVVTETDRDKYCVKRIVDFYARQPVDLADYFLAAWRFEHRAPLGKPDFTLANFAKTANISEKYLTAVHSALVTIEQKSGPLAEIQALWRKLPAPEKENANFARSDCQRLRDHVIGERKALIPKIKNLAVRGVSSGSQPLVMWKNRQMSAARMRYVGDAATESERQSLDAFCKLFPDDFFLAERDRIFLDNERNQGRLLSAGFHLMVGYYRDDQPLYDLILDDVGRRELDALWQELNFIAAAPIRQYKDFVFFERAEPPRFMEESKFDFARSEDKDVVSAAKMTRLEELHLAKAKENGASPEAFKAIEDYYAGMSAEIRWHEKAHLAAEPSHLESLLEFTAKAYRRPLSEAERSDTVAFYRRLRQEDGLSHEDALRDAVVSVLMSPYFSFRADPPGDGVGIRPLSNHALANRLSYFLWSSMPDDELLVHATSGDLIKPDVLLAQSRRMLRDDRIRRLAVEFGGNWLDFRRFEEHNSVDRQRFPQFTNELRTAMYEEPIRFFTDVVRENRSVTSFLDADYTFVNAVLAKHYGIPFPDSKSTEWVRIDNAKEYGRGGLLPMSVFLTYNSPGLRTSPVKRGYWVVRRLLGEVIPPPPPNVPELPKDESQGKLPLRELLARHRADKNCAACHQRFDSLGLAFESFGPVGERRDKDLGGRIIDARATFPGGHDGDGLSGLRDYLHQHRQADFQNNLCRKLLAYALGRGLLLSDEPLLAEMNSRLSAGDHRFHTLVETIVTSRQFLN